MLCITVLSASNLPNLETIGKIDPYVNIQFKGITKKTTVKSGELNPQWNETLQFDFTGFQVSEQDELKILVKDRELVGHNRLVGTYTLFMRDVMRCQEDKDATLDIDLTDINLRPLGATLSLKVKYMPPTKGPGSNIGTGREIGEEGDKPPEKPAGGDAPGGGGGGGGGGDAAPTSGPANPPAATGGTEGDSVDGKSQKRNKNEPLSTRKQDFQLRLKVSEGRQLPGSNVSPTCRVTCRNQKKQTKVIKSSNAPYWNELFFFNFNTSPAELFDEILLFEVYDSKKLRSDSLIGSFKMEIGLVYDEPHHAFLNKWLLLCDPEQVSDGHKGYLKVSMALIGPGDDPPSFQDTKFGEEDDIEANLLRPAGLTLRPATFKLKLYCAEDLPRMDSNFMDGVKMVFTSGERKELVDPYFRFGFAGRHVDSKVIYTSFSPQWNSELRLGLWFPSMCEKLRLQLFDWDRFTKHDCIGTMNLITSQISQVGNDTAAKDGYLPMFGPCFVNFYGSPREYSELPTEYDELNFGQGQGVAYRGRVLIELQTLLGELPLTPMEELTNEDVVKAQKFMRRRKFKLHTTFLDACMIGAIDSPIEFEVSIGNYGNRLDEFLPPSVCSTQPTNPVFDGCYYYYLPWGEAKPCVVVESHWEDVIFRLEALNYLINFCDRLDVHLGNIHLAQKGNVGLQELAISFIKLVDELIEGCKKPLPEPNPECQVSNMLDKNMLEYRRAVMKTVAKEAAKVREEATDIDESLIEIEALIEQIKTLMIEPQNSIPDVMIWMITGEKRIACYRCPSNLVIWSANPEYRGKYCGALTKFILQYPGKKAQKENKWEIPAMIRGRIWLGLEKDEKEWHSMSKEGELTVFAETYENQVSVLGKWTNRGPTMSRPKWSDVTGKIELNKDQFRAPPGWTWEGDWYINPEMSMLYEKDANLSKFMEDVYECQSRIVGGSWKPASVPYSDVKGDACAGIKEIELPSGWEWQDDWQVDLNRAVDENGWEYSAEASLGGYGPVEKMFHMCRRRRWLRTRRLVKTPSRVAEQAKHKDMIAEGWEYAPLFTMKFHLKERKMDLVRRRRWHRKMVTEQSKGAESAVFQFATTVAEEATEKVYEEALAKSITSAPRMFMYAKKSYTYQLRAYMYQARDLLAGDSDGLSDPFVRVAFLNQSQSTEKILKTLCPTWDQSLIFESIKIWGEPKTAYEHPPDVVMEVFDYDNFGSAQFLGRAFAKPVVKLDPSDNTQPVLLKWYPLTKGNEEAGEILAAFEIFLVDGSKELPFPPPKRGKVYMVPNGIRPQMVRTAVEVMCWGLRNMKTFQLLEVSSPNVELEINGTVRETKVIKDMSKNPNFDEPIIFFDVMLPKEELYAPPINIRVKDNRAFGRRPLVGVNSIKSLEQFRCEPLMMEEAEEDRGTALMSDLFTNSVSARKDSAGDAAKKDTIVTMEEEEEDDIDWWSKFYASVGEMDKCKKYLEMGYDKIQVYANELEKVKIHNEFKDFCITFPLSRGKCIDDEETTVAGEFKGTFYVYPLPGDLKAPMPPRILRNLPTSSPVECLVRVYVLRAFDLQSNDPSGLADPYVEIKIGKQKVGNNKDYIANTLNPIFGKMFEVKAVLPKDKDLIVRIKDYDFASQDDTIGETVIDLENRFLTKCRATVGLPQTFCVSGVCKWRDSKKPTEILEDFCSARLKGDSPIYTNNGNMVTIGRRSFSLSEFEQKQVVHSHLGTPKERLALHILHTLPSQIAGTPLVVEHVETRPLFNTLQPGIEQGKVQMWIDLFPVLMGPPGPPVNISARQPKDFELRIVVWNTKDVILEETSITGEKMSDIYVKGWIGNPENKQETDVHYRSLDGEGNFNWRFVFPFKYIPAEQCLVIREKEHFWSLDETERRLPPILTIQIWDNDKFSKDDFLGSLELNLNAMPNPTKSGSKCTLDQLPSVGRSGKPVKLVSLFDFKRLKGFWPCASDESGTLELTGKVEMELELVTGADITERPVGRARDDPNQHPFLDPPKRPETSFFWFTSPWKTFKFIIWKKFKWYFITGIIILFVALFLFLFFYAVPGATVRKILGA